MRGVDKTINNKAEKFFSCGGDREFILLMADWKGSPILFLFFLLLCAQIFVLPSFLILTVYV